MQQQTSGNTTRLGMEIGGSRSPAERINMSGWAPAGNYGVNPTATGATVGASTRLNMGGQKFDAEWRGSVSKASMGAGMGILFRSASKFAGPLGVVAMLADFAPTLQQAGIKMNPDAASQPDTPFLTEEEQCSYPGIQVATDASGWCKGVTANFSASGTAIFGDAPGVCSVRVACMQPGSSGPSYHGPWNGVRTGISTRPANWDTVRPKYEAMNPMPSDVIQKQLDWAAKYEGKNGIEPYKINVQPVSVSGPPSLPSTKTDERTTFTRTGANGQPETVQRTTTKTTETSVTYDGDKVKIVPRVTSATTDKVTDSNGVVTETTNTETTETVENDKPKEEGPDLCEKNPDILACQKLGELKDEIPKSERTIEYAPVDLGWGSGSCPAPHSLSVHGQSLSMSYQPACDFLSNWIRPVVIAFALLAAFFIVAPGRDN